MIVFSEKRLFSGITNEGMHALMDSVSQAMIEESRTTTPLRTTVDRNGNSLMLMPSLMDDVWGLKILTLYPDNPKRGEQFIHGAVFLIDGKNGEFVSMFNGGGLTALRTGAVGGLGVRTLAGHGVSHLGLLGAGVQGYWQVRFACAARNFKDVYIYDTSAPRIVNYQRRLASDGIEVKIAQSANEVVENSDVVIAATNSKVPLFDWREGEKNFGGKLFVAIGSYRLDMRELPDELIANADLVCVDTLHALDETGDLIVPIEKGMIERRKVFPLSDVLGKNEASARSGTTVYKCVGGAVFDLFTARKIFETSVGENVEF